MTLTRPPPFQETVVATPFRIALFSPPRTSLLPLWRIHRWQGEGSHFSFTRSSLLRFSLNKSTDGRWFWSWACYLDYFEDDHDEVVVVGVNFISKRSIHLQERVLLGIPYTRPSISWSMVVERKLDIQHDISRVGAHTVPNHSIVDVLAFLYLHSRLVPECWNLSHVQYFWVDLWIRYKECTLALVFNKSMFIGCIEQSH